MLTTEASLCFGIGPNSCVTIIKTTIYCSRKTVCIHVRTTTAAAAITTATAVDLVIIIIA